MKKWICSLVAFAVAVFAAPKMHAAFVLTLSQTGNNVQITGTGTLNLTSLTLFDTGNYGGQIFPSFNLLISGPPASASASRYTGMQGSYTLGSSVNTTPNSGTGATVGVLLGSSYLVVPQGYTSGTALTSSSTYNNATFSSLGFTPGTYTYTWGSGPTADSLTITGVVPEPSTWILLGVGVAAFAVRTWQRRRVRTPA